MTKFPCAVPCENQAQGAEAEGGGGAHPVARVAVRPPLVSVPAQVSILVTTNPRFTTVVRVGEGGPPVLRILRHGPVLLAMSQATAARANGGAVARVIRSAARQVVERARLGELAIGRAPVAGTSDIGRAVVTLAGFGRSSATAPEVHKATELLASTWVDASKEGTSSTWVEPMMIAAAVMGAILDGLGAEGISLDRETPLRSAA